MTEKNDSHWLARS